MGNITKLILDHHEHIVGGASTDDLVYNITGSTILGDIPNNKILIVNITDLTFTDFNDSETLNITGIGSLSDDGTNIGLLCGNVIIYGTSDQTVSAATRRFRFSTAINKQVIEALYS